MPYSGNDDLPDAVKTGLNAHQQTVWRSAFNAAHASGKSEEACFAIAWAAATRGAGSDKSDD